MPDYDPLQRAKDDAVRARAVEHRENTARERALSELSPERREEARKADAEAAMLKAIDAAVDRRLARLVIQSGHGIQVTGGNGNYTVAIDVSALTLTGSGAIDCTNNTINLTFKLT
jgi:hypothetical protein